MFGMDEFEKNDYKEDLDRVYANIKTNMGEMKVELFSRECPETVWNFVNLAEGRQDTKKEGLYYDNLNFHRVIKGFVIQGGCPEGNGRGGPGYQFKDECHTELRHDGPGILSMANSGPGTNGSQFFITCGETPHLNGRHTVFGQVTEGLDVLSEIESVETGMMDKPLEDIIIEKVEIIRE